MVSVIVVWKIFWKRSQIFKDGDYHGQYTDEEELKSYILNI